MSSLQASPARHYPSRVAIVRVGNVGATFAYTLLLSGLASEIVLIDADRGRAEGEAMDLSHAIPFASPARIWAGDFTDCAGAAATVIAAGVGQRPGESRLALLERNVGVLRQIVPAITRANSDGVIVVATNPVDLLSDVTRRLSGLPPHRVIGSGTMLDTARFRFLLSRHFGVDPRSVHAWIIGEHGDSEVPVWSLANIAGMRLADFCAAQGLAYDPTALDAIFHQTRDAAYDIIARKGATYYAVAAGLLRLIEAILRDQRTVLSVSSLIDNYYGIDDIYLSLPAVIHAGGVEHVLRLSLNDDEASALRRSAEMLITTRAQLDLASS